MPFPAVPGRRSRKMEIKDKDTDEVELGAENTTTICTIFKRRRTLNLGRDPDSSITNKLCSIKTSPWFEKRVKNYLPFLTKRMHPLISVPGSTELMHLMWIFHTNWIVNKTSEQRPLEILDTETDVAMSSQIQPTVRMEWIENFLFHFQNMCENVYKGRRSGSASDPADYADGDSPCRMKSMLNMYISIVVDVAAKEMTKMSLCHFNAFKGVNNWSDTISEVIEQKDALLEKMEAEHDRLLNLDPNLDEGSIWGLKPLRRSLAPPYYKTPDGLVAAPAHPNTSLQAEIVLVALFNFNKQKWTTKDLKALGDSVREVIIEKRLLEMQMTSDILLDDCATVNDMRMHDKLLREAMGETVNEVDEQPKRRGRPKKFGKSPFLGEITPHLFTIKSPQGDIVVRYKTNNNHIEDWRDKFEDKINKPKLKELLKLGYDKPKIDWLSVSNKATLKTKKNRSPEDCWLAFTQEAHPDIYTRRWSAAESAQFKALIKLQTPQDWDQCSPISIDWDHMNTKMGLGRTPFQLFYRWRNNIAPPRKMVWNVKDVDDKTVNELIKRNEGNWKKVAVQCGCDLATKKQIIDRYKKNSNAALKSGSFIRVEDALLLLTIEKLKGHLTREGHFGELIAYLPWRFETVWRDRAGNLFADWIVPWKIEEDKRLLELATSMSRNWRKIADSFDSFKNRKGCLTRWKILQRRLKTCKGVEEYHEAYSMIRYNVFQYKHLKEVLSLLKTVYKEPVFPFNGFSSAASPSDANLQDLLLSFDRLIMASTIKALEKYIAGRDAYWKVWLYTHGERKRTFDRRTFHSDNAQSMASALHIRGIPLKPRNSYPASTKLNDFQTQVYFFYAQFCKTKALKKGASRPYLPEAHELMVMTSVKEIIDVTDETIQKAKEAVAGSTEKKRKPYRRTLKKRGASKKRGPPAKRARKNKKDESEDSDTPPETENSEISDNE